MFLRYLGTDTHSRETDMWKKENSQMPNNSSQFSAEPVREWDAAPKSKKVSTFGNAIQLEGIVRGEDDVILNGRLRGKIELPKNSVTVGLEGYLEGDVLAQVVIVEGAVHGNIKASERVILHRTAQLLGNISCEKVTVEEGARVNGSIDMSAPERTAVEVAPAEEDSEDNSLTH